MKTTVGGVINYKLSQIETTNAYQTLITPHTMGICADIAHRERRYMSWHIYKSPNIFDSDGYGSDDDREEPEDEYGNEDFEYECYRDDRYIESIERNDY